MVLVCPASEHCDDYRRYIVEVITILSDLEDRQAVEVLNDILGNNPPGDVPAAAVQDGGSASSVPAESVSRS
jgi:hypothetical protein